MTDTKRLTQTKTLWVNALAAVMQLAAVWGFEIEASPEAMVSAVVTIQVVVSAIMRAVTKTPVSGL